MNEEFYRNKGVTENTNTYAATESLSDNFSSKSVEAKEKSRCMGCMELCDETNELCPYCGYVKSTQVEQPIHIVPGTILDDKYMLGRVLGYGGFGVTYIGWDLVLQRKVAIKEYLPSEFSTRAYGETKVAVFSGDKAKQFEDGKAKFIDEAKRLAKFQGEKGIVNIFDSFEENGTAYIVMEYLEGETLEEYLRREGKIPAEKAVKLLSPVIESLDKVHTVGIIHRDVSPDNIMITKDGRVKLIDFGAARYATTTASRSLTVIIKPGYSPEEQYTSRGEQGAYTDVYSLGAVLYKMVTGEKPPDALERRANYEKKGKDILIPVHKLSKNVPKNIEYAIYNAMNLRIEDRTPDMVNFMGELYSDNPIKRKDGKIKKVDILTWPLWAKILAPSLISLALILSTLLGLGVIGPRSRLNLGVTIPDGMTLIPDVVTETLDMARKKLKKSDLEIIIGEKVEDERIKENLILAQAPEAGEILKKGTIIEVKISAGAPKEFVINVEGFTKELAQKQLEELGFKVEFKEEFNEDFAPGAVISQSVKAGEQFSKGGTIKLVISKGDKDIDTSKSAKIPEVVGMDIEKAKELAKKNKLYIVIEKTEYSPKIPKNQIISQTPEKGFDGHQGDTIKVTVSLGIKTSYMPDVVYRTQEKAIEMLENLGLKVKVVEEENKEVAAGTVFKQSIKKGVEVKAGTIVTITVSKSSESQKEPETAKPSNKKLISSGKCGSSATYTLDVDGLLTISGTGRMYWSDAVSPWYNSKNKVTAVVIENGITSIHDEAFADIINLRSVTISNSVTHIGVGAFWNCDNLSAITLPNSIKTIGHSAFLGCNSIKSITIPNGVASIEKKTFESCTSLRSIKIPNSVKKIGNNAFDSCESLQAVAIPSGVTYLGDSAFRGCLSLRSITIPNGVKTIAHDLFDSCENLKSITIPNGITSIGESAFSGTAITSITIPNSVKSIGNFAFSFCPNLSSIRIPSGVKGIEEGTFSGCSSLKSITIPNSVTYIDNSAFRGCTSITSITIPNSVTRIGDEVFAECPNIKSITIPESVVNMGYSVFMNWTGNQTIYIKGKSSAPSTWDSWWNHDCRAKIVWNA